MNTLLENLEFKAIGTIMEKAHDGKDGKRIIRGYASTDAIDRQGEIISLQALRGAENDLLRNSAVFLNHEHNKLPVGKVIAANVDEKGLLVTVEFTKAHFADDLWSLIDEGVVNRFSIGGRVLEAEEKRDKSGNIFNEITKIELFEVSIVGIPANPEARFSTVKSFSMAITEELKKREVGKDMAKEIKKEEVIEIGKDSKVTSTTKELEVTKTEEVTEEDPTLTEEVGEVAEEAILEAEKSEAKEEVKKEDKSEELEAVKVDDVTEVTEEKPSLEESSEAVAVEDVVEKSTDDKILDALGLILQHLTKEDKIEKVEEIKEVEATEETQTEKACDKECEDCECEAEEVKEEIVTEKVVAEVQEVTAEKSEEVSTEKVVKVEETQEVKKAKETPLEVAARKGEIIIADTPYGEEQKETQLSDVQIKKLRDKGWAKLAWGK